MKLYLSHGLGVNSWALYLYLIEQGEVPGVDFEAVAVNHGADLPESYEYLEMIKAVSGRRRAKMKCLARITDHDVGVWYRRISYD